jgi:predicted porin
MMKKLILAAAITATFGLAQAQMVIYGAMDAGVSSSSKDIAGAKTSQTAVAFSNFSSSRIGFKNTEDIGDGKKVYVVIETGISSTQVSALSPTNANATTPAKGTALDPTTLGSRELSPATLIKLGQQSTAVRDFTIDYDASSAANITGSILANDASFGSNRIVGVTVTQKIGDFTLQAATSQNTTNNDPTASYALGKGYTLSTRYVKGPLSVGVAYQTNEVSAQGTPTTTLASDTTVNVSLIGASYDLGIAKVYAQYGKADTSDAINALAVGTGTRSGTTIGVSAPVGAFTPFAQVSVGSKTEATKAGTAGTARSNNGFYIGTTYALSKKTRLYAATGQQQLSDAPGQTGESSNQTQFGMTVSF